MNLAKLTLAVLTAGALAFAVPAMAANDNNSSGGGTTNQSGAPGGGNGQNALAGNGSNHAVGDNPDATDPTANCVRSTSTNDASKVVCPDTPASTSTGKNGLATPAQ